MNKSEILKNALKLPPEERIQLIESITQSLSAENTGVDSAWAREAEKRYEALITGKAKAVPWDEIVMRNK